MLCLLIHPIQLNRLSGCTLRISVRCPLCRATCTDVAIALRPPSPTRTQQSDGRILSSGGSGCSSCSKLGLFAVCSNLLYTVIDVECHWSILRPRPDEPVCVVTYDVYASRIWLKEIDVIRVSPVVSTQGDTYATRTLMMRRFPDEHGSSFENL